MIPENGVETDGTWYQVVSPYSSPEGFDAA